MNINLFNLKKQLQPLEESLKIAFDEVLKTTEFTYGQATKDLEENFAKFIGVNYSLAVRSGTAALILAIKSLELNNSDEVITTPMTFSATADAIVLAGAKPVFADIDSNTGNISLASIKKAKTKNTKAVLVVHFAGIPCEMTEIVKYCKDNNLILIEDASHAHGSSYKGQRVGSFGDIACFSLYPSKTFGALGNAGIITTNNRELLDRVRMLAEHGVLDNKYQHNLIGFNEKIDNLQAAFLNVKFQFLNSWIDKKIEIANKYQDVFFKKGVRTVNWNDKVKPSLYIFSIFLKDRDSFADYLKKNGVSSGVYYPVPLHLQKSFSYLGYKKGDFPQAEKYATETLAIPLYPELEEAEIDYICQLINNYKF